MSEMNDIIAGVERSEECSIQLFFGKEIVCLMNDKNTILSFLKLLESVEKVKESGK